jgi:hypothetical protein
MQMQEAVKSRGRAAAVRRGEMIREHTTGIRAKLLLRICQALLKKKTALTYEQRASVLCLYYAIGRAGEVAAINCDNMRFDEDDQCLLTGWNEFKTGHCNEIPYFPHAKSYEMDIFHALACYFVTAGGGLRNDDPDEPNWLFPNLAKLKGGPASKISKMLSDLIGDVEGLTKEHTSHGLRAGPSDDLAMNELVDIVALISLGNW